jgi:hypothetical protein
MRQLRLPGTAILFCKEVANERKRSEHAASAAHHRCLSPIGKE